MRNSLIIAALLAFVAGGAVAQTQTPAAQEGPQNPAIKTTDTTREATGPVKGANSFTEGEAKSRIEARGFANVTQLKKDDDGIWRGRAMKDGSQLEVALDYQGNVFGGAAAQGTTGSSTTPGGAGR
jgi:hypothetical protein